MSRLRLPVGYTFAPSDAEFVAYYLRRKAMFRHPYLDLVPDFHVFTTVPNKLPSGGRIFLGHKFFFMNLKDVVFEDMDKRNAGTGYWKTAGPVRDVVAGRNNKLIGKRNRLVFWRKDKKTDTFVRTRWVMHEFRVFLTAANPILQVSPWAGYKIFLRKSRKNKNKNKPKNNTAEPADHGDNYKSDDEGGEEDMEVDHDVESPSVVDFATESGGASTRPPSPEEN